VTRQRVVVVAVLVELATPEVSPGLPLAVAPEVDPEVELGVEPGPPMELVLPGVGVLLPLVEDVSALVLPGVLVLPEGVAVVLGVVVDVVGVVALSSRLVQAPRETAATSASAAHEVRDAFIGKLLEGLLDTQGRPGPPRNRL
jgi:hypothetical protein